MKYGNSRTQLIFQIIGFKQRQNKNKISELKHLPRCFSIIALSEIGMRSPLIFAYPRLYISSRTLRKSGYLFNKTNLFYLQDAKTIFILINIIRGCLHSTQWVPELRVAESYSKHKHTFRTVCLIKRQRKRSK